MQVVLVIHFSIQMIISTRENEQVYKASSLDNENGYSCHELELAIFPPHE